MHNCSETKEQLAEILLDSADSRLNDVLSAELRACAECRAEFEALNTTLRLTTRLKETVAPAESYWTGYHARLRQKLTTPEVSVHQKNKRSWLVRFARSSVPVPVPAVAAVLIACSVLVPISIRGFRQPEPPSPTIVRVPVEVPVIQEKIVTRVVYREKRSNSRSSKSSSDAARVDEAFAKSQKPQSHDIPVSLVGFKPTEEIKFTVIKGGSANEK